MFVLLTTTVPAVCFAGLTDHPRVAVLQFDNKSYVSHPVLDDKEAVQNLLTAELVGSGAFEVIEPAVLDLYAEKNKLKNVDLADTAKIAKAVGINYIFTGNITSFTTKMVFFDNQDNVPWELYKGSNIILLIALNMRIYDTETGNPVLVAMGQGSAPGHLIDGQWNHTDVHEALAKAAKDLVHGKAGLLKRMHLAKEKQ